MHSPERQSVWNLSYYVPLQIKPSGKLHAIKVPSKIAWLSLPEASGMITLQRPARWRKSKPILDIPLNDAFIGNQNLRK